VESFPPGRQITVCEAADDAGVAQPNGHIDVGPKGDSVALAIQPGNAIFVHINLAKSSAASVLADITQEP
jgi:hypothetical protein